MKGNGVETLKGKVAIVTGGSSGIGKAICCTLAVAGIRVMVVGRNRERLAEALESIRRQTDSNNEPGRIQSLALDVRSEIDMIQMADQTVKTFGRIDILIGSAGILRPQGARPTCVADISMTELETVLATNLKGIFLSNRSVLPTMIKQRSGQIINIASLSGRRALPLDAPYCASKFAVIGLSQALAEEVRPYGIKVHTLLPGNTDTPIWGQNRILPKAAHVIPVERMSDVLMFLLTSNHGMFIPEFAVGPLSGNFL